MQVLRKLLDALKPHFEPSGRLGKFYRLYELGDVFLFTPGYVTKRGAHVRDAVDIKRVMITVGIALFPCGFMALYNSGYQANMLLTQGATLEGWRAVVLAWLQVGHEGFVADMVHGALLFFPVFIVCNVVGGIWEVIFATVRGHEVNEGFLVTGLLFPLILPPTIPLWQVAVGISFGVVIGKEIFGGTGYNILNPALTGRAFLFFAYPGEISGDMVWIAAAKASAIDGYSGATALAQAVIGGPGAITYSWWDAFVGLIPGSMGETSVIACLFGALVLIGTGIGSWRIMVSGVAGLCFIVSLFNVIGSNTNPMFELTVVWHLVLGGFAFGIVFMATDPVSAAMSKQGRLVYGFLIGALVALIRVINPAYPEGTMLAILFMNVFSPFIDYLVVQGHIKRRAKRNAQR